MQRRRRSDRLALHLVTRSRPPRRMLLDAVRAAAENGVDWVQVRDYQTSARDLFDLTTAVIGICRPRGVRVAVSDRIDVALAAGADGIQIGQHGLAPAVARRLAPDLLLGVSVHNADEARVAAAEGADRLTFGHVFPTASHPGVSPRGIDALRDVVDAVPLPVIAIGGIGVAEISQVRATGIAGVAVISAILEAPDPARATQMLREALDS